MLDGGQRDDTYQGLIPEQSFVELRRSDREQRDYFLGREFESLRTHAGESYAHLTPPRRSIIAEVGRFLPTRSDTFAPVESLALGGLGSGWGLGCNVFSEAELQRASLPIAEMRQAYQNISDLIGISGSADDAASYTHGGLERIQPSIPADPTIEALLARYSRRKPQIHAGGFRLGRPALALLTEKKDGRCATTLRDMDFYSDAERAAWRPWILVEELMRDRRFTYEGNVLVTRFTERDGFIEVSTLDIRGLGERTHRCRRLVLAAGVFGSARIVLRSRDDADTKLPLLCNPYTYMPCVVPSRVGRPMLDRNTGLAQLVLLHDPDSDHGDIAQASLYTYRSLLLFRLLRELPINARDARQLLQFAVSGLLIAGIHHPQGYSNTTYLRREPDAVSPTGDRLAIISETTAHETERIEIRERLFMRALRQLGAYPVKRVHPPNGASIHYAGTLPFADTGAPYTLSPSGRLSTFQNVYVADGSGFTFLPAKGLTLSLMANAYRVAKAVAAEARA